jgi:GNAT superfamily N-acetyltransferase
MNVTIRKANRLDVDAMVRLANDGGPSGPHKELPTELPAVYYESFDKIAEDSKQFLMVAEHEGVIVGTFHMTFLTYLAGEGRDDCQIEAVHVNAAFRNHGIGAYMMKWAIAEAKGKGCRRIQLTTNKVRMDAHRFYQRLGFEFSHEGAKLWLN